ncbi:hypothetical protein O3M35_006029 [Rhynocoris fuscipes]|uniref:Galactosylceramide sulfotransferase-like n=1 Tax=Rhynocoris fuscipes TaxID=488301 RepID=A0AAW1DHQ6_9HEMI
MRNGTVIICFITVCFILLWTTIIQFSNQRDSLKLPAISKSLSAIVRYNELNKNEETCVMFLKAHKCASTTVQNILMRFGYSRGLDFVLPLTGNYIGNPELFDPSLIPAELTSPSRRYDIFAHHTRYNYTAMKSVMKDNCKFVTILRDPATLYESLFNFYHIENLVNLTLKDIMKSQKYWPKLNVRMLKRIGLNQMSWDLGYNNNENIDKFIAKIDKQFHLVMISEYMEASLILLADLMNWPLEYVVSLKLNSRQMDKTKQLTEDEHDKLIELNLIDAELYDYFLEKFRQKLIKYGRKRLFKNVNKLLKLNKDLQSLCVDKLNNKGYAKTTSFDLRNSLNWTCIYSTKSELPFTDEIRNDQKERFKTMKKLEMLLIDIE